MSDINTASIGEKCEKCGNDNWIVVDNNDSYIKICTTCANYIQIDKINYLKDFICDECNCFEGKIEENDKFLAVRCTNCGKQYIKLEKHTTDNRRTPGAVPKQPETYEQIVARQKAEQSIPKCPKCGCTNIQVVRKKWSWITGFMTNATERVCAKCNYRW